MQVQPMGNELVNAQDMDATQRGEVNEHHQNVKEPVVQKDPVVLSMWGILAHLPHEDMHSQNPLGNGTTM